MEYCSKTQELAAPNSLLVISKFKARC